jgi:hypothetical protein
MSKYEKVELSKWDKLSHDELKCIIFSLINYLDLQATGLRQPQYDKEFHIIEINKQEVK